MGDFGDFASGAASGALAGSSLGPWGALAGGVGGGLLGLFTDKQPQMQQATNPYQGQIDSSINRLMSSRVGAQMAQNQSAGYRRDARAQFDAIQGNPGVAGNANVMSAMYNKAQSTAADSITNANVHGAGIDQEAHLQGLNAAMGEQKQGLAQQQYNNYVTQMNNRPGPMQQILMQSLSSAAGSGLGKLMAPGADTPTTGTPGSSTSGLLGNMPTSPGPQVPQSIGGSSPFQSMYGVPGLSASSPSFQPGTSSTGLDGLNFGTGGQGGNQRWPDGIF